MTSHSDLPPELSKLNSTVLRSFRTAFSALDPLNNGHIQVSDLPLALRSLSLSPTDRDFKAISEEFLRDVTRIPFLLFCKVAAKQYAAVRTPPAMAQLFAMWDPNNTGVVSQAAMRDIFTKLQTVPMSPPELVDALIAYADPTGSGSIKYGDFCDKIFKEYEAAVKLTGTP